jgi:hypothetical protein
LYIVRGDDIEDISIPASVVLDDPCYDDGIHVDGGGMDMVFAVIYDLWGILFPDLDYRDYEQNWRKL